MAGFVPAIPFRAAPYNWFGWTTGLGPSEATVNPPTLANLPLVARPR